jgi:hypothetical protein
MSTLYQWSYISNINILTYLKYILKDFHDDLIHYILTYLIPNRQQIKVIYESPSFQADCSQIFYHQTLNYNEFIYQLTKAIMYKYKTIEVKKIIPCSRQDMLLLMKKDMKRPNDLIQKNIGLFYYLFIQLYCDYFNSEKYLCLDYSPYHEINEKYYNFLNNNNVFIL